jgi:hypothetical protein
LDKNTITTEALIITPKPSAIISSIIEKPWGNVATLLCGWAKPSPCVVTRRIFGGRIS